MSENEVQPHAQINVVSFTWFILACPDDLRQASLLAYFLTMKAMIGSEPQAFLTMAVLRNCIKFSILES